MGNQLGRPDLSVIVVSYNRSELALRTLESARAAIGELSVDWHVVDSGSVEPVPDMIEQRWPDVRVSRRANGGFAAANNHALAEVRGRYVLLLNPDVEVAAGSFPALVSALDARPKVGIASVLQCSPSGSIDYSMRRDPKPWRLLCEALLPGRLSKLAGVSEMTSRTRLYRSEHSADWLCGAFLIVRAQALAEVGPLDERFFLYSEETDWCYRCRTAGWEVRHLPIMAVIHHRGGSYGPDLLAQLSYSRVLFAEKHYGPGKAGMTRRVLALHHLIRAAAFGAAGWARRSAAARAQAEWRALLVTLGRSAPPFSRS